MIILLALQMKTKVITLWDDGWGCEKDDILFISTMYCLYCACVNVTATFSVYVTLIYNFAPKRLFSILCFLRHVPVYPTPLIDFKDTHCIVLWFWCTCKAKKGTEIASLLVELCCVCLTRLAENNMKLKVSFFF